MNSINNSNPNNKQNKTKSSVSSSTVPGQPGKYPYGVRPPDQTQNSYGPNGSYGQQYYHYHPYKKLYRSTSNKWIGGVCGGIAKYFNKDPVLIRLLWVVVTLLSAGAGIIGYILFWLFVDKEPVHFLETKQYTTKGPDGALHVHHHYRPTD